MGAVTFGPATCVDMEAAARASVARTFSPFRRPEMTGRTFATWHRSPAFRAAFLAAWAERLEVPTITRAEYDRLREHQYAGPAIELTAATRDRYEVLGATHWRITDSPQGAQLGPVKIEAR